MSKSRAYIKIAMFLLGMFSVGLVYADNDLLERIEQSRAEAVAGLQQAEADRAQALKTIQRLEDEKSLLVTEKQRIEQSRAEAVAGLQQAEADRVQALKTIQQLEDEKSLLETEKQRIEQGRAEALAKLQQAEAKEYIQQVTPTSVARPMVVQLGGDASVYKLAEGSNRSFEYQVTNNYSDDKVLKVFGFKQPIYRDSGVEDNCGDILLAGKSCKVKFVVVAQEKMELAQTIGFALENADGVSVETKTFDVGVSIEPKNYKLRMLGALGSFAVAVVGGALIWVYCGPQAPVDVSGVLHSVMYHVDEGVKLTADTVPWH